MCEQGNEWKRRAALTICGLGIDRAAVGSDMLCLPLLTPSEQQNRHCVRGQQAEDGKISKSSDGGRSDLSQSVVKLYSLFITYYYFCCLGAAPWLVCSVEHWWLCPPSPRHVPTCGAEPIVHALFLAPSLSLLLCAVCCAV
jgi:hypothetical protein